MPPILIIAWAGDSWKARRLNVSRNLNLVKRDLADELRMVAFRSSEFSPRTTRYQWESDNIYRTAVPALYHSLGLASYRSARRCASVFIRLTAIHTDLSPSHSLLSTKCKKSSWIAPLARPDRFLFRMRKNELVWRSEQEITDGLVKVRMCRPFSHNFALSFCTAFASYGK